MKHREDAIKKAKEIMDKHQANGLSESDAKLASIVTIEIMLSVGVYPGYQSLYQRVLNYLTDSLTTSVEINKEFIHRSPQYIKIEDDKKFLTANVKVEGFFEFLDE